MRLFGAILAVTLPFIACAQVPQKAPQRTLMILLDREGYENVAISNLAITTKLIANLLEKKTPMLVSVSLWQSFLERRREFEQRKELEEAPEAWLFKQYSSINERLSYWLGTVLEKNMDAVQAEDCALGMVNKEFYDKEITEKYRIEKQFPHQTTYNSLYCFLTEFNEQEWRIYDCEGYYLFIPVQWFATLQDTALSEKRVNDTELSDREYHYGIKYDHLSLVSAHNDHKYQFKNVESANLVNALRTILVSKKEYGKDLQPSDAWSLFVAGHGLQKERLADLTFEEFDALLQFLDDEIPMKNFVYKTCYGSGYNAEKIFNKHENPRTYAYPIVSLCLTDNAAVGNIVRITLPYKYGWSLNGRDVATKNNKTQLKFATDAKLTKFFDELASFDGTQLNAEAVWKMCSYIMPGFVGNTPQIMPAGSRQLISVYPHNVSKISALTIALHRAKNIPLEVKTAIYLLLESSAIPLMLTSDRQEPLILVSMVPGKADHYIEKVSAPHLEIFSFFRGFLALDGLCFDKQFLIDELILARPNELGPLSAILEKSDEPVRVLKVFVKTENDYLLRAFFQAETGDCYMGILRKMDKYRRKFDFSSLQKLSPDAAKVYQESYEQLKTRLISASSAELEKQVAAFKEKFEPKKSEEKTDGAQEEAKSVSKA